ncbi:hypothetical protein [Rhodopila sp.]|uniref:hypothetical protein n=1 Tax=Rhodopila sp. TaxID=2480087 RepID=UPI003D1521E9
MSSPQLAEIEASLQSMIRRAYDLGQSDALKKVVAAVHGNQGPNEPLALMAPETPEKPQDTHTMNGTERPPETPWWAWRAR